MFLNNTYREVSVNDIAKAVGITKGGFYHYFKSKDELFSQVVEDFMSRYMQLFLSIFKDETMNFKQKLDFIVAKAVDIFKNEEIKKISYNPDIWLSELKKYNNQLFDKAIAMNKEMLKVVIELFEKEKQKGTLRKDLDCEGTAVQLLASLKGEALYSVYAYEDSLEKNMKTFMDNFWRGIKA